MMLDPEALGRLAILDSKKKYMDGIDLFIFISAPKLFDQEFFPDFNLTKSYEDEIDIVIIYPHYVTEHERETFYKFAKDLSEKYKVLLYEALTEAGGGGELIQKSAFVYQQF